MQTKKGSFIEATINIGSGFVIAFLLTAYINSYPIIMSGYTFINFSDGLGLLETIYWTGIMTIVSITRSYFWRRYFNKLIMKGIFHINKQEAAK